VSWCFGGKKKDTPTNISATKALKLQESPRAFQIDMIGATWCLGGLVAKKILITYNSATKALKLK
jgi:hypothetical protein